MKNIKHKDSILLKVPVLEKDFYCGNGLYMAQVTCHLTDGEKYVGERQILFTGEKKKVKEIDITLARVT